MLLAYILGIFSIFILLLGVIIFLILLLKKKSKLLSCSLFIGFIILATLIGIVCVIFFTISIDKDNVDTASKYFDNINEGNQELLDEIERNKEENSAKDKEDNTSKEIKTPSLKDQGKIKNDDYHFIITVGKDEVKKIRAVKVKPFEGVTNSYMYCYKTKNNKYEGSSDCKLGEAPIFSINIYTKKQWQVEAKSPFAGTVMGQDGGYYFVFYHPNGILPNDVPSTEKYYNSVIKSIDFAD